MREESENKCTHFTDPMSADEERDHVLRKGSRTMTLVDDDVQIL